MKLIQKDIFGRALFLKKRIIQLIGLLSYRRFNGINNLEFINPKNRKIKDIIRDQILIWLSLNNGHKAMVIKTIKKSIPKLLLVAILFIFILLYYCYRNINQMKAKALLV